MDKVVVRGARSSDKKAVTDFCSRIWEGWDYLPRVWDQWLEDPQGAFLVAELDGRPVGTDKITVLSPGEVWLEGLRVDPRHHGQGIARAMNKRAMEIVAGLSPITVRFSTGSDNQASRHMGEQDGFRLLLECQPMACEPLDGELLGDLRGGIGDVDDILAYVRASPVFQRMKGLFAWGWAFKNLDRPFVERIVMAGGALLVRKTDGIDGLALHLRHRHAPKATLGFIHGRAEAMVTLARQVRSAAGREGCPEVFTMATEKLAPALSAAGFQQEEPVAAVVYQLSGARLKEAMLKTRRKR